MGCNMCVVQKPEEQHRVMLQVSGKEGPRRGPEPSRGGGGPRGSKEPLMLQVLRRSPRGRPPPPPPLGPPPILGTTVPLNLWGAGGGGPGPPPAAVGLVDSGTQTDITFESRLGPARGGASSPGGAEPPPDYFDPTDLGEPERPEELEYEEVELYKTSHRDKLGLTVCYRTDGEEDAGIYVGEVNPNSIAAKDGRIREGDRIVQINGVEVQDREEAVAFLTREQQTNISLLLARPESQRWKDSDREDFLDDFGSDEDGELRQRGPWTPPGQPPSPATPCPRGGPEPDSGVGRTDESTRNEESSEHDLLGDEGGEGPPLRPPPRHPPPTAKPGLSPRNRFGTSGKSGAGSGAGTGGGGGGGRPGSGKAGGSGEKPGTGSRCFPGTEPAALSQAELRRYRQLRGRLGGPGGGVSGSGGVPGNRGGELALLEEELRHLEFKCRHLLRAQKMERLRERCLRAWLEAAGGGEGGAGGCGGDPPALADISEAPERGESSSAYNTGESCRSSPLLLPPPPPQNGGGGFNGGGPLFTTPPSKAQRGKRPGRDRLLKARAIKILEERGGGSTTDDDARSELKTGRYWSREQRKQHLARAREQRKRRELLLSNRGGGVITGGDPPPGVSVSSGHELTPSAAAAGGGGNRRVLRKRNRRILDNWATIQEMLARGGRGEGGRLHNPLLSVTTV